MMSTTQRRINGCFIEPYGLRVIVERDGFKYGGKLIIPDKAQHKPTSGTVVAVPESGELDHLLGLRVVFGTWSGTELTFKNRPAYTSLSVEEVMGRIHGTNEDLELVELTPM